MKISFKEKFTDREIDAVIDSIYTNYIKNPKDDYYFNLSELEYIGHQELLFLTSIFKNLIDSKIDFQIEFFKKGASTNEIPERVKKQIIQIWEVWKIWKIIPYENYFKYFGIDGNSVQRLQEELQYYPKLSEIYTRHKVTPFIVLDFINNYNEIEIHKKIQPIYKLNEVIEGLLRKNNCYHPFTSNSLSTIITEELYINFLDHSLESSFEGFDNKAFMSISFHPKLDEESKSSSEIQSIKSLNFQTECLEETKSFYYDNKNSKYKNIPYIQFSFIDFGQGIVSTLTEQFLMHHEGVDKSNINSKILQYAFNHDSSRHPILMEDGKIEQLIPRGLFDILTIVRRYSGLLIVRSNRGKILYDFSRSNDLNESFSFFGSEEFYFPGTLISLYIPAIEDSSKLNISTIKPEFSFLKVKPENKMYISILLILRQLQVSKGLLYSTLIQELKSEICKLNNHSLVFISFKGCELERRIIKKTIYFLLTNYDINYKNNVVILNSPQDDIIDEIAHELLLLNDALKNYKIHPLPIIDFDEGLDDLRIKWLGIYEDSDKELLNNLLYEDYSIPKSDFHNPSNICGQLNTFDSVGNLISNFPCRNDILNFFKIENNILSSIQVKSLQEKHNCIRIDNKLNLYLCNGNYYQKEYVELNNLINDINDCAVLTQFLFTRLSSKVKDLSKFKFIGITTISQKLLKSMETQRFINSNDYITLDNYHNFENDLNSEIVDVTKKQILICDVISTGYLTQRLNNRLVQLGTNLEFIAVITSCLDVEYQATEKFLSIFGDKLIFLNEYPIKKYRRSQITNELSKREVIRINPYTNIPISLSINETNYNDSIIFHSTTQYIASSNEIVIRNKFIENIKEEAIRIGFLKFNSVVHPYFFNTKIILEEIGTDLLKDIFIKINNLNLEQKKVQIFYPRKSGMDYFNFDKLKDVLNNHSLEVIEIERFGTPEGWRFPHNTNYLNTKIENNICFIIDDGSCSGDSLIQMVDEISFYNANEIIVLCLIGRVQDHKREFFSRISRINVKDGKRIPISIFFACHWHIPTYYIDENPTIRESHFLEEIINLQNTPRSIRNIASRVKNEIRPKTDSNFSDYKYLPKVLNSQDKQIPKKDLLLIREELGKVIGYRLYKESFNFFDLLIKKYENRMKSKDRYKEIELLCATFTYEPYLYEKIKGILPDIVEKIEEFVRVLIFSDLKIYDSLTYEWNRKDIIHLFFVVFKDEKLVKELDKTRFQKLIEFTQPKESAINYVLYKMLEYFPIKSSQLKEKKFDSLLRELLNEIKNDGSIASREIRKYFNFISTLPSRDDFKSQIDIIVDNYNKQRSLHLEKTSFDHNISLILALIRECIAKIEDEGEFLDPNKIVSLREIWFELQTFINPILSFSISFKEYLKPYPYFRLINKFESGEKSLREIVGFNESVIFNLNENYSDIDKLRLVEKHILQVQYDLKVDSDFHKLVSKHKSNLLAIFKELKKRIESISVRFEVVGEELIEANYWTKIPEIYSEILISKEITTNLTNHSSKEKKSGILMEIAKPEESIIVIKITNVVSNTTYKDSNGEGIKCLILLSDFDLFGFKYSSKTVDEHFIQTLTFKTDNDGH